jgi:hypothetical protein
MERVRLVIVACCIGMLAAVGCGVFKSSTSQASSESSSDSSSSCSGSDDEKLAYRRDVRDVTARYASAASGDATGLARDVGAVAARHGVVDWEADRETFVGIGEGFARAGLGGRRLASFTASLTHADAERAGWIEAGYGRRATP